MRQPADQLLRIPLREMRADLLNIQRRLAREHRGFVRYRILRRVFTLVADPDASYRVFVGRQETYRRGMQYDNLALAIGRGLICTEGETWRRQRRQAQPIFGKALMARIVEITAALAAETAESWAGSTRPVDVFADLQQLTMRVISRAMFGRDLPVADDLSEALALGLEVVMIRNISPVPPPLWLPTRRHRRFKRHLAAVDRFVYERIDERLADRERFDDILGDLVRAAGDAPHGRAAAQLRRELRDQAVTFFYAGLETTASALAWTWLLLAQNPDAEARFHAELASVLRDGRTPAGGDLSALSYTSQVVQESMRLYPPVYTLTRRAAAADQVGEWQISGGDNLVVPLHALHRMPEYWDKPDSFCPERFAGLTDDQRKAYLPFNIGPHRCIGASFATTEMLAVLAVIGQRVRLRPADGYPVQIQVAVTQRPLNGLWMTAEPRAVAAAGAGHG
jgi:cytochrome P450